MSSELTTASATPARIVFERALATLDLITDGLQAMRQALRQPYKDCDGDRPLGFPRDLGLRETPTHLDSLVEHLTVFGGPAAAVSRVGQAVQQLDRAALDYANGRFTGKLVRVWRDDVEKLHGHLAKALDDAWKALEAWSPVIQDVEEPIGQPFGDTYLVYAEDLQRLPGKRSLDSARDLISSGNYGKPMKIGRFNCVEYRDMLETLKRRGLGAP